MDDRQKKEYEEMLFRAIQAGKSETSNLVNDIINRIENKQSKNGANFLNKWWKAGAVIVALIVGWTTLQIAVVANTKALGEIDSELDTRQVRITTNENNIMNFRQDIDEIKVDVKEVLKELKR